MEASAQGWTLHLEVTWGTAGLGNAPPAWHSSSVAHVSHKSHSEGQDNWQIALPGPSSTSAHEFL